MCKPWLPSKQLPTTITFSATMSWYVGSYSHCCVCTLQALTSCSSSPMGTSAAWCQQKGNWYPSRLVSSPLQLEVLLRSGSFRCDVGLHDVLATVTLTLCLHIPLRHTQYSIHVCRCCKIIAIVQVVVAKDTRQQTQPSFKATDGCHNRPHSS